MHRPTEQLELEYRRAAQVSGTFPDYEHTALDAGAGYHVTRHDCRLLARCSTTHAAPIDCDVEHATDGDTALLECSGSPGAHYGFVELSAVDDPGAEVFLPWKHEVYAVPHDERRPDFFDHYVRSSDDRAENYHYFGEGPDGRERHQLLPLVSSDFPDGTPHRKRGASGTFETDLWGCQGTSGSGVLQPSRGRAGRFELLGPVTSGNSELVEYLCNHVPSLDGEEREPGSPGLRYDGLERSRYLAEQAGDALFRGCDTLLQGSFSVFSHLACVRNALAAGTRKGPLNDPFEAPTAPSLLDHFPSPVVVLGPNVTRTLEDLPLPEHTRYRIGIDVWSAGDCDQTACPELSLLVAGREVLRQRFEHELDRAVPLAATFETGITGFNGLTVRTMGGTRFELSRLTLREEGRPSSFDTMFERLEVVLVDPELGAKPQPMRFVGDGKRGFEALLLPGESMVFARQALAPGQRWFARFDVSGAAALTCGLLDVDGKPVREVACGAGSVHLDDTAGTQARAGFFIRNDGAAARIDDLVIVSDSARDADEDGLPDPVDDCPEGPLPPGAQISVVPVVTAAVCNPEPAPVVVTPPSLANTCGEILRNGFVARVSGERLEPEALPIPDDGSSIELPLGKHRVRWLVTDAEGNLLDEPEQEIRVELEPDARCCGPSTDLDDRRESSSTFSEIRETALCVALGSGGDFVGTAAETDVVWAGAGSDYLSTRGGRDLLIGGEGSDYLTVLAGPASLYGGPGADTLSVVGSDGARLFGGGGADTLLGGAGPDWFVPGAGATLVVGEAGDDTFTFYDACELAPDLRLLGGAGADTVIAPVSREHFETLVQEVADIEHWEIDDSRAYFADCFEAE